MLKAIIIAGCLFIFMFIVVDNILLILKVKKLEKQIKYYNSIIKMPPGKIYTVEEWAEKFKNHTGEIKSLDEIYKKLLKYSLKNDKNYSFILIDFKEFLVKWVELDCGNCAYKFACYFSPVKDGRILDCSHYKCAYDENSKAYKEQNLKTPSKRHDI